MARRSTARVLVLWAALAVVLLGPACSSDDEGDADGGDDNPTATTTTSPPEGGPSADTADDGIDEPDVRLVSLNLLHGLPLGGDCPPDTDGCQAGARLDLTWQLVEDAGCPEILAFQEVGPTQQEQIPLDLPSVCDGTYQLVSADPQLPVEQWVLSSLPVLDAATEPLSGISRSIQWVRLDSAIGPVDVVNTHFVASIDDLPCTDELCGELCEPGVEAGRCNPVEALDVVDRYADPSTPTILVGDLNATIDEPRLTTLTDAGFVDVWTLAGNDECDPDTGGNCTSGLSGDGPFGGLDQPVANRTSRIDFVLVRPGDDCDLQVDDPTDGDGDGTATGIFGGEPADPPVEGVYWPSDHAGVQLDLSCR